MSQEVEEVKGFKELQEKAIDNVVANVQEEANKLWNELWPHLDNNNLKKVFVAMLYAKAAQKLEKSLE